MKKNRKLCLAIAAFLSLNAFAQQGAQSQNLPDGFYRVHNHLTKRYVYICDKGGGISYGDAAFTSSADMGVLALYLQDVRDRFSDPASLCYIEKVSHKHDIHGQNTSFSGIVNHYVQIQDAVDPNGQPTYQITPLLRGYDIYLRDKSRSTFNDRINGTGSNFTAEFNKPTDTANKDDINTFYWDFIPFSPNGDEYLGIAPDESMKVGGKYYKPYIIGYDMTLLSPGMKAYYVSDLKDDAVIMKEIEGTIPHNTPIIIECSSKETSSNRVDVSFDNSPSIAGNRLIGQYFCYASHGETAYTVYDRSTMRLLMVKDGKLVFGTVDEDDENYTTKLTFTVGLDDDNNEIQEYKQCLKSNSSYLKVPADFPDEIEVMTEAQYNIIHGTNGDLDGSGSFTTADLHNEELGLVPMVLKRIDENMDGDINGDGRVSIADIAVFIKRLLSIKQN